MSLDDTAGYATATNQIAVYYGGVQLRKTGYYKQEIEVAFDTPAYNLIGVVSSSTALPATTVLGTAYLVTATNQVWSYTASKLAASTTTNGYTYTGVKYIEPQFTLTNVTTVGQNSTATLQLLIDVSTGTELKVVQRLANTAFYQLTDTPLLDDTGSIAEFLRVQQASLPDKYYYGK